MRKILLIALMVSHANFAHAQGLAVAEMISIKKMGYTQFLEHFAQNDWIFIDSKRLNIEESISHDLSFGNCLMLNRESREKFPGVPSNELDGLWCLSFTRNTDSVWAYYYYLTEINVAPIKDNVPYFNRYPMGITYKCSTKNQHYFIDNLKKMGFILDFAMDNALSYKNNKTHDEVSIIQCKGIPCVSYYIDQCYPYSMMNGK